jgi:hypothetical protein
MDGKGGTVYVIMKNYEWQSMVEGTPPPYNSGSYTRISGGTKAAQWTVGVGSYTGNTGLAIILDSGKMLVANFANQYSDMNGTFIKLDTSLTLEGTWKNSVPYNGDYAKVVATAGGFVVSISSDNDENDPWHEKIMGIYSSANPATLTITHAKYDGGLIEWGLLTPSQQNEFGSNNGTYTAIIYNDSYGYRCEWAGRVVWKQP